MKNDSSETAMQGYAEQMHEFFIKYEKVFEDDVKVLFGGG
jgi:hypothetical protein